MPGVINVNDPNRPDCPQCGKTMARRGKAQSGRERYTCIRCKTSTTNSNEAQFNPGYDEAAAAERAAMKISREVQGHKRDNLVDLAGYAECCKEVREVEALLADLAAA